MMWAEVFAGGIGGFVGRLRPNIEPPPHTARRQYQTWCRGEGVPWLAADHDYETRGPDEPLVADDSDVAIIAAHAARMAIDCLIHTEASGFPHPAYVIGLKKAWLFAEPMEVRPFDFVPEGRWHQIADTEATPESIEYVLSLLKQADDESRDSA
jgi:hypothetical protein